MKAWQKLGMVVAGLSVAILMLELGLRLARTGFPSFYILDDPDRGDALRPGAEGWWRSEGLSYVRISSQGLRDQEHSLQKPPGTYRIAVLGDSYAEAMQVPQEAAFWSVAERQLNQCQRRPEQGVEVINFGVSGYGTAQELITLREHVWAFSPDLVLLAFTTGNDVSDNSRALSGYAQRPYFLERGDALVLDNSFRNTPIYRQRQSIVGRVAFWLTERSRLLQSVRGARARIAAPRRPAASAGAVPSQERGLDTAIYHEPSVGAWQDAWHLTERLVSAIDQEVTSHRAAFLLVTLTNGQQVYPDSATRATMAQTMGVTDWFYPEQRLRALATREVFDMLALAPSMRSYAEAHQVKLHGFDGSGSGHWNREGHRVAGELIADHLCSEWSGRP